MFPTFAHTVNERVSYGWQATRRWTAGTSLNGRYRIQTSSTSSAKAGVFRTQGGPARPSRQPVADAAQSRDHHEFETDLVESALGLVFPPEKPRSNSIGIDSGRYAELNAYDHAGGVIYLEAARLTK
jgi:hypothetical protein